MLAAIRGASSFVSSLAADRRPGSSSIPAAVLRHEGRADILGLTGSAESDVTGPPRFRQQGSSILSPSA